MSLPEDEEGVGRRLGDDTVAQEVECLGVSGITAHPSGSPIIHVTNAGFRRAAPLPVGLAVEDDPMSISLTITSVRVAPLWRPLSAARFAAVPDARASCAVGVGRSFTAPLSVGFPGAYWLLARWPSAAVGVGSSAARSVRVWPRSLLPWAS